MVQFCEIWTIDKQISASITLKPLLNIELFFIFNLFDSLSVGDQYY